MSVLYGVPSYGLYVAFIGSFNAHGYMQTFGIPTVLYYYFFVPIAILLLIQLIVVDLVYTIINLGNILRKQGENK